MEALLKIEDLSKSFLEIVANDKVSFEVLKGEIHCLLGENGAGKSTLSQCIYGNYRPDSGKIYFKGKEVVINSPRDSIQLGIGMVHQHFKLAKPLSVLENIMVGTQAKGLLLDLQGAAKRLTELCKKYELDLDLYAKIWQLSLGEQQWVEILKALFVDVELLILDEPTASLTPHETKKLFNILQQMKKEGYSIIFITHKLNEVMAISDRVTILKKGKNVATVETKNTTKEEVARIMVGRDVIFDVNKEKLSAGAPLLKAENLSALNDRGQEIIQGMSFTLNENEILGIAGISGNGQTELFEVLIGVRNATKGAVYLAGRDITAYEPKRRLKFGLAHIPADRVYKGVVMDFSIAENLVLGCCRNKPFCKRILLDDRAIENHALSSIENFNIVTSSYQQKVKYLSGGNLQKVILARELAGNPKCLIADQPTRGLDVGSIEYVNNLLLEQRRRGTGILLISEDLDQILALSDRIAVMFKGRFMGILKTEDATIERIGLLMGGVEEPA